ncbi:MAG: iron-sulfur cluster assembly scaffold protein [Novosphingobium sp.]
MSASPVKLYTPQVLALATRLAAWPNDPDLPLHGAARSPTCGSSIALSLATDDSGAISDLGLAAHACAIGQAAAAIFCESAKGCTKADLVRTAADLDRWLRGEGAMPDWPGLDAIAAAQTYPARHGAVLLSWKAAIDALP